MADFGKSVYDVGLIIIAYSKRQNVKHRKRLLHGSTTQYPDDTVWKKGEYHRLVRDLSTSATSFNGIFV